MKSDRDSHRDKVDDYDSDDDERRRDGDFHRDHPQQRYHEEKATENDDVLS